MATQFFLFIGGNTYALTKEVRRWQNTFREKHGEANLEILSGKTLGALEIQNLTSAAPFLSEKRLIFVEGIPKWSKEECEAIKENLHPGVLIAVTDPTPDKRTSTYKFLLKHGEVRTFQPLPKSALIAWIQSVAHEHGAALDGGTAGALIDFVGTDQWFLENELLKAIAYMPKNSEEGTNNQLARNDVFAVCLPSGTHAVWALSDLLGKGKTVEAVSYSAELLQSGEDAFALWNIVLFLVRNLSILWIYLQDHSTKQSSGAIAKATGIPFPSVQSLFSLATTFDQKHMRHIVANAVDADFALKTGEIRATNEQPIELVALLERQLLSLSRQSSPAPGGA